jgi:hypothetical protein
VRPPCKFKNAFASRPTPKALLSLNIGRLRPSFRTQPFYDSDIKLLASGHIVKDYTPLFPRRRGRVSSMTLRRFSSADGPLVDTVLGGEELAQLDLAFF